MTHFSLVPVKRICYNCGSVEYPPVNQIYTAVPCCLETYENTLFPEMGTLLINDRRQSTLVLRGFYSNSKELLAEVVADYFREDDASDLMKWLV